MFMTNAKNSFKKIITSILLTLAVCFTFTGCSITAEVGGKLNSPLLKFDESKQIVYWNSVVGADKYNVKVDGNVTATINVTFFDVSDLSNGSHLIQVKALPSSFNDVQSEFSNGITVMVGGGSQGNQTGGSNIVSDGSVEDLVNQITDTVMLSNFTVYLKSKYVLGVVTQKGANSLGSGTVIKKTLNTYGSVARYDYYVLTNNHVVYKDTSTYNSFEYSVTDAFNKEYSATLIACDAAYDLAIVKFTAETDYPVIPLANENCSVGDKVITLGQPKGQKNAVSFGAINTFTKVAITENPDVNKSNVTFDVYQHTAPIESGSSGGALLDYNFNLVGVNYSSSVTSSGKFAYSYAVPVLKVKEFLVKHNFNV